MKRGLRYEHGTRINNIISLLEGKEQLCYSGDCCIEPFLPKEKSLKWVRTYKMVRKWCDLFGAIPETLKIKEK